MPLFFHCTKNEFLSIKDFFSKCYQTRSTVDLVTFTEAILNGKQYIFCAVFSVLKINVEHQVVALYKTFVCFKVLEFFVAAFFPIRFDSERMCF